MTVTDMLPDLTVTDPTVTDPTVTDPTVTDPTVQAPPWTVLQCAPTDAVMPGRPTPYPLYWLVGSWSGAEPDDVGRSIVERRVYVSPMASSADHESAVEIIADALCRWVHPDDIRWCHLDDGGTGGYTVVGRAIRSVSVGEGCSLEDEEDVEE